MQLVAYGAQDVYLTGNPQITFFKVVYRRHTNFAIEAIEQTFNGNPAFGSKATVQITRNGDLVTKMYLKAVLAGSGGGPVLVKNPGNALISSVELQIGGTRIDKHYGLWLSVWSDLTRPSTHDTSYNLMVGNVAAGTARTIADGNSYTCYVPLQFFCCRNDGLALPLIALQYHDVRLEFEFSAGNTADVMTSANEANLRLNSATLLVDYIYLDSEERKRFAQASHEYLIEQVQHQEENTTSSVSNKYRLNFNHPVKELIWVYRQAVATDFHYGASGAELSSGVITSAQLKLNGHDRASAQDSLYFNSVQPYQHHTRAPSAGVHVYSFALNPEEHQPSGSCNFSRIDNAELNVTTGANSDRTDIFAVNYNVLRIMSGMGGLAYSN
jgi:hypothetical protein